MNRTLAKDGAAQPPFTPIRFEDFKVCWAGPCPLQPGFCFGSEDGRLLFTDESGTPHHLGPVPGSISGEAINGVARSGEWLAVATRQEVTMRSVLQEAHQKHGVLVFPHGAHGVAVAESGCFVAALGRTGIMMLQPGSGPSDPVGLLSPEKEGLYFYHVLALPGSDGRDLLVCAARLGGIGIAEVRWGQPTYNLRVATFDGLDVVDLCAIDSDPKSPAVAAVSRDGTLILIRDALRDGKAFTVRFDTVQGTAYRLLSRGEQLFLLTSHGLYGFMGLAGRLVVGMPSTRFTTRIRVDPMEAVDANLVGRWLLVITPDEVLPLDLDLLGQTSPDKFLPLDLELTEQSSTEGQGRMETQDVSPKMLTPEWKETQQTAT